MKKDEKEKSDSKAEKLKAKSDAKAEKVKAKEDKKQEKLKNQQAKERHKQEIKKEKAAKKAKHGKKGLIICLVVFVLLLCLSGGLLGYDYYLTNDKEVAENVWFMNSNLSNSSPDEAKKAIDAEFDNMLNRHIILTYGESNWDYTAAALGLQKNTDEVFKDAYSLTRSGNIINRYQERLRLWQDKTYIDTKIVVDTTLVDPILAAIAQQIGVPAENARFTLNDNGEMIIVPSVDGVALDSETTKTAILNALSDSAINSVAITADIYAHPERTTEDLQAMNINGVLSTFTTKYNSGQGDRSANLSQASQYLDMTIVDAGATFSFNKTVGERTTARGFRSALVIDSGVYTPGLGGGVCQVSTTLYGALLRAPKIEITQRKNHTLPCAYVPPSQDAMVAWGSSDLCFKNNYPTPIVIHASCGGGAITMTVFGDTAYKQEVELTSDLVRYIPFTTETTTDPGLASGETKVVSSGGRGLESYLYRKVYENGAEVLSETVNHDKYSAQKRVVSVGP
ncbi:MAG: VanW family protein [Clostridiales bacterium]